MEDDRARSSARRRPASGPIGVFLLAIAFVLPAVALAQPAVPKPPAAPAAPSAAIPSAPIPSAAPPVPSGPSIPAAQGAPAGPAPAGSAQTPPEGDEKVILGDEGTPTGEGDVPATLPRELRRNVKPGSKVQVEGTKSGPLTIEEIVNSPIVSASNRRESALSAPAFVVVITQKDLRDRGYTELDQILDDLPGMDVIRPYGDVYVKSYWRGYRPGAGADPYLVMIDGVVMNHLFFRDAQILSTFPLSNVDHVEVVYGPASAVYGPNAAMGVINVITKDGKSRQDNGEYGATLDTRLTWGGAQRNLGTFADSTKITDATAFYTTKDYRLRLTTRVESSVLDRSIGDDFEYTKNKYYSDPRIWGAPVLATYPNLGGSFRSPDEKRAVDLHFYAGGFEAGAQYFNLSTGLGTRYAGDRFQTSTPWTTSEISVFGRHSGNLSPNVVATTLVQFRRSDIASPSVSLGRYRTGSTFDDVGPNLIGVEAPNAAVIAQEDLTIDAARNLFLDGDDLTMGLGVKYQHMELSKDYRFLSSVTFPLASPDPIKNVRNDTDTSNQYADGRLLRPADEIGAYVLGKYAFPVANALHAGMRFDHSTLTDSSDVTFRGGYVGTFDAVTVKGLYGQAVYAPSTYDLSRAAAAGNAGLKEERSQTLEGNLGATLFDILALSGDVYYVQYANPIVDGRNLDARRIAGADAGARLLLRPIMLWAYYSRYLIAEESSDDQGGIRKIGDLAFDKVWGGITFDKGPFTATVLGRYIGPRDPVATNPLGRVPAYVTLDGNAVVRHVGFDGLSFGMRVTNILDTRYSQPGMQTAGSGNTPGFFNGASYTGSQDDFNSRLVQPRRSWFWTMGLEL